MPTIRQLIILVLAAGCVVVDADEAAKAPPRVPTITIDVADEPQFEGYAQELRDIALEWYPKILQALGDESEDRPGEVRFVFRRGVTQIAAASGRTIVFNPEWFEQRPNDVGVVVHELVHVIQAYPRGAPGWVVEGLADYIRWGLYEPQNFRPHIDPQRSKHTDGYQTAAAFFVWLEKNHPGTVAKVHHACRAQRYDDAVFKEHTGSDVEELWEAFIVSLDRGT